MSSHLTRHVFRCLIANENILHPGCLRRQAVTQWRARHRLRRSASLQQRRTLWVNIGKMFSQPRGDPRGAALEPGVYLMQDFIKRKRLRARLPETKDMAGAVHAFLSAKLKQKRVELPDTQARLVLENLRHVMEQTSSEDDEQLVNWREPSIVLAAQVLMKQSAPYSHLHHELATMLHEIAKERKEKVLVYATYALATTLSQAGRPLEARELLLKSGYLGAEAFADSSRHDQLKYRAFAKKRFRDIVSALATEGNEAEMLRTVDLEPSLAMRQDDWTVLSVILFYDKQKNTAELEKWMNLFVETYRNSAESRGTQTIRIMLDHFLEPSRHELGRQLIRELLKEDPSKAVWDEILAWDFAIHKSVDELSRQLDVMISSGKTTTTDQNEPRMPDTASINRFVEVAIAANDPYLAERLIDLGRTRGIQPDATTLVLQMQYRLSVNDIDGALNAYKHLQSEDLSGDNDMPAVNKLVVALCQSNRHDFDTVMNVVADMSDRRASFEPLTVQTLAILHLKRDELQDVQDLVRTHAHLFSAADRATLRKGILDFCVDDATPVANMWDAYKLLTEEFDEMPRDERTLVMQDCFRRQRPDMAIHVFNHMRMHSREDTFPTADTYTAAFVGAAQVEDEETLLAFHNQLKIDSSVTVTTKMLNALMLAYMAVNRSSMAISIWEDIETSAEGPSYNSIVIALRACAGAVFGDLRAAKIWSRLTQSNVDIDQGLWAAYIPALAGNGGVAQAIRTVEDAEKRHELVVDDVIIGRLYNASLAFKKAEQVQEWATLEYPGIWNQLQSKLVDSRSQFGAPIQVFKLDEDKLEP